MMVRLNSLSSGGVTGGRDDIDRAAQPIGRVWAVIGFRMLGGATSHNTRLTVSCLEFEVEFEIPAVFVMEFLTV
jgi:hypothetical protein